jgi:hypothetical protein
MRTPSRSGHTVIPHHFEPLRQRRETRVIRRGLTRAMFVFVGADDFARWDDFAAA